MGVDGGFGGDPRTPLHPSDYMPCPSPCSMDFIRNSWLCVGEARRRRLWSRSGRLPGRSSNGRVQRRRRWRVQVTSCAIHCPELCGPFTLVHAALHPTCVHKHDMMSKMMRVRWAEQRMTCDLQRWPWRGDPQRQYDSSMPAGVPLLPASRLGPRCRRHILCIWRSHRRGLPAGAPECPNRQRPRGFFE